MAGLVESSQRSIPGEPARRWFSSKELDLIVWLAPSGSPTGFQLCYNKGKNERAITWMGSGKLTHSQVDSGEVNPLQPKASPILLPDGSFNAPLIVKRLRTTRGALPDELFAYVVEVLMRERVKKRKTKRL